MSISQRHHYIPKFIIRGFTNKEGKIAVFDKEKMTIDPIMKSPKQIFFEWDRNSFIIKNEKTDFVEKLYSRIENDFAPVHKRITADLEKYDLTPLDMFHLISYIGVLYAGLPINDDLMFQIINDSKKEDFFVKILSKGTNQEINNSYEIFESFKDEPAFIQSIKIMKATIDYLKNKTSESLEDWKPYYSSNQTIDYHLIGDNPIIMRDSSVDNVYNSELIYPLSKHIKIFHSKGKTIKEIKPKDAVQIDTLIFIQSKKYVCGPDLDYLKTIASHAKNYNTPNLIAHLKESLFQLFE
ncbi:MAG: DUF4238 domain-containing protein [Flavobacteriaceae bacterium]